MGLAVRIREAEKAKKDKDNEDNDEEEEEDDDDDDDGDDEASLDKARAKNPNRFFPVKHVQTKSQRGTSTSRSKPIRGFLLGSGLLYWRRTHARIMFLSISLLLTA